MPMFTSLAALSQTAASNPPDGSVDAPSSIDDQLRLLGSFIAQLRDGVGFSTSLLPSGSILDFGGAAAPSGFLACNGAAVSRTTYAALFSAIGTTWGSGDGSTTFNVPDLRRRATIGVGGTQIAGPANTLGAVGGEEAHILTTAELAAHSHTVTDSGHTHSITDPGHSHVQNGNSLYFFGAGDLANGSAFPANTQTFSTASSTTGITGTNSATANVTAANTGSGTAHNNMQPSAVVNKIIKI